MQPKLLIIEDEEIFQNLLRTFLAHNYALSIAGSGEEGLVKATDWLPDLIILDIILPGIDGYQTCEVLRANDQTRGIPILFLSQYQGLADRLKAYGAGGDDYLSKPINEQEITLKIAKILQHKRQHDQLTAQLQTSYATVITAQLQAAKIQFIGRFLQQILLCDNFEKLTELFFYTAQQLGVNCVLYIRGEQPLIRSSTGGIHKLEHEILELSQNVGRIHSFGQNRAIFNWKNLSVLVRNVDDNIDTFAILMDALEVGVHTVNTLNNLLKMLENLHHQNQLVKDNIDDRFKEMNQALKQTFLSLSFIDKLSTDDEDLINDRIDAFNHLIGQELRHLDNNNEAICVLVDELRSQTKDCDDLGNQTDKIGEVTFF